MSERLICPICNKEIIKGNKILAFDEFAPSDWDWNEFREYGVFDEIMPVRAGWSLAHYYCIFKRS